MIIVYCQNHDTYTCPTQENAKSLLSKQAVHYTGCFFYSMSRRVQDSYAIKLLCSMKQEREIL